MLGKDLSNPIPTWVTGGADKGRVPYGVASDMNTPAPDPSEEYRQINTQLLGLVDEANRGQMDAKGSYNAPEPGRVPTMDGFVADYASMLLFENGQLPTYEEYAQIMTGYPPEQMPVLSTIARRFATFDHWFCEVPSCTFPNRSFFQAGTSSDFVINFPPLDASPVTTPRAKFAANFFSTAIMVAWSMIAATPPRRLPRRCARAVRRSSVRPAPAQCRPCPPTASDGTDAPIVEAEGDAADALTSQHSGGGLLDRLCLGWLDVLSDNAIPPLTPRQGHGG